MTTGERRADEGVAGPRGTSRGGPRRPGAGAPQPHVHARPGRPATDPHEQDPPGPPATGYSHPGGDLYGRPGRGVPVVLLLRQTAAAAGGQRAVRQAETVLVD